jgi:hypothetical protein
MNQSNSQQMDYSMADRGEGVSLPGGVTVSDCLIALVEGHVPDSLRGWACTPEIGTVPRLQQFSELAWWIVLSASLVKKHGSKGRWGRRRTRRDWGLARQPDETR